MNRPRPTSELASAEVGDELPSEAIGPLTPLHIMRWSAAIENWHRIHYDRVFAVGHDGLPDVVVNGTWKQHLLIRWLRALGGPTAWLWKLRLRYVAADVAGDTLLTFGSVVDKQARGGYLLVLLNIGLRNQRGVQGTTGEATIVLADGDGPTPPYPFDPTCLGAR